ncbi:glycoside hydrolase family 19 protein [Deinococcus altitudinis]|uniref:glycoside hydrolase family 19 protein n=1 Tax=Deinococcus altitudinis TaxID=468914 RepID=UPI003892894E
MITRELILAICPKHPAPVIAASRIQAACIRFGIITPRQVAMFLGQIAHESGLVPAEENLNYRAARIAQVWPSRFPTVQAALPFAFNPQALANKVYGGRGGNDLLNMGWLYHGRGPIQLTFFENYKKHGERIGQNLIGHPELLLEYGVGFLAAGSYWNLAGLNGASDRGDVRTVTRAINGGLIGLDDRERLYQRALLAERHGVMNDVDLKLNVVVDAAADLDARATEVERVLGLLAS